MDVSSMIYIYTYGQSYKNGIDIIYVIHPYLTEDPGLGNCFLFAWCFLISVTGQHQSPLEAGHPLLTLSLLGWPNLLSSAVKNQEMPSNWVGLNVQSRDRLDQEPTCQSLSIKCKLYGKRYPFIYRHVPVNKYFRLVTLCHEIAG